MEAVWRHLKKLKLPNDPAVPLLGLDPKEMELSISKRRPHPCVHSSIVGISQGVGTNQVSVDGWWIKKTCGRHPHTQERFSAVWRSKSCHLWKHRWTWGTWCWVKEAGRRRTNMAWSHIEKPDVDQCRAPLICGICSRKVRRSRVEGGCQG